MLLRRAVFLVLTLSLITLPALSPAAGGDTPRSITTTSPCGSSIHARYDHVVWVLLENVGYSVVGSPSAPFLRQIATDCGLATNYLAVSHPSLPNYIALTSGSTQSITDDGEPSAHPLNVPSLFSQLGGNWRALDESMPRPCDRVTSGSYAARHNPAVYSRSLGSSCQRNDLPLSLPLDLSASFTFITPNICDDMHSCPVAVGDQWLAGIVPAIIASKQYQSRSLALFITFDENDSGPTNRVPTYVVAPTVPRGARSSEPFTHYSLLRTTESLLGLPFLGSARQAASMVGAFHL